MAHDPGEGVEEDDGASVRERRPVSPEAQGVAQAERRRRDWVEWLAWQVEGFPGQWHDESVELTVDDDAADRDAAKQSLGVRDGRGACERGDGGQLARRPCENSAAHHRRRSVQQPAER
jgi:hypothetical protein